MGTPASRAKSDGVPLGVEKFLIICRRLGCETHDMLVHGAPKEHFKKSWCLEQCYRAPRTRTFNGNLGGCNFSFSAFSLCISRATEGTDTASFLTEGVVHGANMLSMKKEDYEVPLMPNLGQQPHHLGQGVGHDLVHPHQLGIEHSMPGMSRELLNVSSHIGGGVNMDGKSSTRSVSPPMIPCGLTDEQLVTLSVRELNKQLKNKGLNKDEMGTMKQRYELLLFSVCRITTMHSMHATKIAL